MRYYNFIMAFSLLPFTISLDDFKFNEIEVALKIFKDLNIGHCILVDKNPQLINLNYKQIYKNNILIAIVQKENLIPLFSDIKSFYMKTALIINIDAVDVLKNFFEKNPLKVARFTWLIFANENIGNKLKIPYNCEFLTVELGERNKYFLKEIYYVKNSGPFVVDFGVWSDTSGLVIDSKFDEERRNMRGTTIIRGDSNGYKICHDFLKEIKHREMWVDYGYLLNYTLKVVDDHLNHEPTDPTAPDGSPCCIAQHSLNYFPDAVFPTCLMPLTVVIKFESDIGEGWKAYFKPFDDDLWYSTFGFLIIFVIAFMIIGYFSNTIFYINPFAVFYSFCCQDGVDLNNEKFTNLSSYIAYLMPFIAATVIVPAYSAAILAKLTVQLPRVPFTDLESFARDGTYKLGTLNDTFGIKYFSRSEHPLVSKIYREMFIKKTEYPTVNDEAIKKLCYEKKFAFIPYEPHYLEQYSPCKLLKIKKYILHLYCGFRMRAGSPFKSIFNKLLIKFYASGTDFRIDGVYIIKKTKDDDDFEPIDFSQILPILNLIPLGIFLSLISIIIETHIKKRKNNNKFQVKIINKQISYFWDK